MREFMVCSVQCGYVKLNYSSFFTVGAHTPKFFGFFWYQGMHLCASYQLHILKLNGKTDFSGVQFHVHPGAAVISTPLRTSKH